MPPGPGEDRKDIKEMNKAEWVWALASYEAVIRLTPDKEAALKALDRLKNDTCAANDKSREGGKKTQVRWMKMHEWIVEIVQKAPDKETALDELEKSRKAGPPKSKTE